MSIEEHMPIGEWIEAYDDGLDEWKLIRIMAIGKTHVFAEDSDTDDVTLPKDTKWRHPINPIKQKRDEIMDVWRRQSLDDAYDNEHSFVSIGRFIDFLIQHDFISVE